ncbi:MAG: PHP domain-containing protein, partial [Bifidobacteriaceae bacterium]|nr:PHP domain-containing protein [Bifidobacteriaceae bacterium]
MRIDLHAHSTASDGTDSPGALVRQAREEGLDAVALTDHDTTAGWAEAAAAAGETGIGLVRGAEFSTRCHGRSVHMLSYLHDPASPAILDQIERVRASRVDRAKAIAERLAADLPITWEQILQHAEPGATVGRPHIADTLIELGIVADRNEAFAKYLHTRGPYYVRHYAPDSVAMIGCILAAGGVPVFAHPAAASRGRIVDDDAIASMAQAGLAGLEVGHRDNAPDQQARLRRLAQRLDLFTTGSSDF